MIRRTAVCLALFASFALSATAEMRSNPAALRPGDTFVLPAGRYEHPLVLEGLQGTRDEPIRITAEPWAVLDGTRRLTAARQPWRDASFEDCPSEKVHPRLNLGSCRMRSTATTN